MLAPTEWSAAELAGGGAGQRRIAGDGAQNVVEYMSVAARICEYYNELREISKSVPPVVDPDCSARKSRLSIKALRHALAFSVTAVGCSMSERDHLEFARVLFDIEVAATISRPVGDCTATFPTANTFLTESNHKHRRVLDFRQWMQVPIDLGDQTFTFSYRDMLDDGFQALKSAALV